MNTSDSVHATGAAAGNGSNGSNGATAGQRYTITLSRKFPDGERVLSNKKPVLGDEIRDREAFAAAYSLRYVSDPAIMANWGSALDALLYDPPAVIDSTTTADSKKNTKKNRNKSTKFSKQKSHTKSVDIPIDWNSRASNCIPNEKSTENTSMSLSDVDPESEFD